MDNNIKNVIEEYIKCKEKLMDSVLLIFKKNNFERVSSDYYKGIFLLKYIPKKDIIIKIIFHNTSFSINKDIEWHRTMGLQSYTITKEFSLFSENIEDTISSYLDSSIIKE